MGAPLRFHSDLTIPNGRCVRWAEYRPGMRYSLGFDCALGIPGKDFDAAVLLDVNRVQIATLHGHWGLEFTPLLKTLIDVYGGPCNTFIVGEAASLGLPILRNLWDDGYTWMYRHRADERPGRDARDILGHVPKHVDITVQWLREAIAAGLIDIRDEVLHSELCKFGYRPKAKSMSDDEVTESSQYTWGAPAGENDDLVRALALANAGIEWLPAFEQPKPKAVPGTIGHLLKWDQDEDDNKPKNRWAR